MSARKTAVVLGHALVGWVLCAATIGIGMRLFSLLAALVIHAIGAPVFFALVSWNYFRWFHYTTPAQTAGIFVGVVVLLDFLLVALVIQQSFAMFASLLGTWIPFVLIFVSAYITGRRWEAVAVADQP
jgi:hypothetical protein